MRKSKMWRMLTVAAVAASMTCGVFGVQSVSAADKKTLKVAMECGYAPYNWTQPDDSNGAVQISGSSDYAYGYDVMMAKKIADEHPLSRHLARSAHHLSRTASAVDRRYTMKRILTLGLALLMLILAGCSTEVTEYRQQQPALDIFHYFQGRTEAWGMVQDRSGKQLRRFHVAIDGDVVGDTLTLHERFVYDDGEKQQRVWRIRRTGDNRYQGTAGDIEGVASGQAAGNAFHWRYSMNVEASGSRWLLHFDDWMFLQDGSHLFNKTEMKKFGITVATVTLFFTRTTAEERTAP